MTFAVIRIRGTLKVKPDTKETLRLLRLNQVNHCVLVPENPQYRGMLQKAKDYITWGEIDAGTLEKMMKARGRIEGDRPLTNDFIKSRTSFKDIAALSESVIKGETVYKDIEGIRPVFRLAPPVKGGFEGIKRSHRKGGALGYRGESINDLLQRMI